MIGEPERGIPAGEAQQAVLIAFFIYTGMQYRLIGNVLQAGPECPVEPPGCRVEPEKGAEQFSQQQVGGMPLPSMYTLMLQDMLPQGGGSIAGREKNDVPKTEWCVELSGNGKPSACPFLPSASF